MEETKTCKWPLMTSLLRHEGPGGQYTDNWHCSVAPCCMHNVHKCNQKELINSDFDTVMNTVLRIFGESTYEGLLIVESA